MEFAAKLLIVGGVLNLAFGLLTGLVLGGLAILIFGVFRGL